MTEKDQANAHSPSGIVGSLYRADRPLIPPDYGVPKNEEGLLPWSWAQERLENARIFWVCTVQDGPRPHAVPIDGAWVENTLYFGGSQRTRWARNINANPEVSIHIEASGEIVILEGQAYEVRNPEPDMPLKVAAISHAKYGYPADPPPNWAEGGVFGMKPRVAFGWAAFPKTVTRWRFHSR